MHILTGCVLQKQLNIKIPNQVTHGHISGTNFTIEEGVCKNNDINRPVFLDTLIPLFLDNLIPFYAYTVTLYACTLYPWTFSRFYVKL